MTGTSYGENSLAARLAGGASVDAWQQEPEENKESGGENFGGTKAYMATAHYLRRMLLPLQKSGEDVEIPARVYNPGEIRAMSYRGLTGVTACENEDDAVLTAERLASKRGVVDWMEIMIPPKEMFLDLEKNLAEQSEFVKAAIYGNRQLEVLYIDESTSMMEKIEEYVKSFPPEEKAARANYELSEFYERKKRQVMELTTARAYIGFLNQKGREHDCNMTTSYLYTICGLKGLLYGSGQNMHILVFNAKDDVTVKDMKRAEI